MCNSATRSTPVRAGGRGGTTGGVSDGPRDEGPFSSRRVPRVKSVDKGLEELEFVLAVVSASPGRGLWYASLASWKVRRAVSMRISRPLRSSMSNLAGH